MATKLKIERVGSEIVWTERAAGRRLFAFAPGDVADALRERVFDYGVKQILSDAAAGTKTEREMVAAMEARAGALRDGTWGQRQTRLPDADVFGALVALGKLPGSDDARVKWTALKPSERRALGRLPEVAEWLDANGEETDAADILAALK